MELIIRNTSGQPIYDQIRSQIKAQIIAGTLQPGEALPSIRALARKRTQVGWRPPRTMTPPALILAAGRRVALCTPRVI